MLLENVLMLPSKNVLTYIRSAISQQSSSDVFNLERTSGSGNALYIFEFRDPSLNIDFSNPETISTVPFEFSPTLGLLISTFGGLSLYMKRRANLDTN